MSEESHRVRRQFVCLRTCTMSILFHSNRRNRASNQAVLLDFANDVHFFFTQEQSLYEATQVKYFLVSDQLVELVHFCRRGCLLLLLDLVKVTAHFWHTLSVSTLLRGLLLLAKGLVAFSKLAQACKRLWTKLAQDARYKLRELFALCLAVYNNCVGCHSSVHC